MGTEILWTLDIRGNILTLVMSHLYHGVMFEQYIDFGSGINIVSLPYIA